MFMSRYKPGPRERITITNLSFESLPTAEDKVDNICNKTGESSDLASDK